MSRNLCQTNCNECPGGSEHIVIEGPVRPVTEKEDPAHFRGHAGLLIAEARCVLCDALYFAWVDWPGTPHHMWQLARACEGTRFVDLSYRHAFNDEPSVLDLPVYEVETITTYRRRATTQHPYFSDREPNDAARFKARWDATVRRDGTSAFEWTTPSEGADFQEETT